MSRRPGLRIGVNALYLIPGGVGGTEIYLRNLLGALAEIDTANEYLLFTNRETSDLLPGRPNFRHVPQRVRAANRPARILWEQTGLPLAVEKYKIEVLFNPGFTAPLLCPCPRVTVFHDLQHKRHPGHFRWFDLPFWRFLLFLAACQSERLICVSETTRQDLLHYYPVDGRKVHVIGHGVEPQFFELARNRDPQPYFLCVSTLHPHKNLERLIRVFSQFRQRRPEYRLVLAGMKGFQAETIQRLITNLGLDESVRVTGWIPREELYELYRRAGAFIYPSTFEGFGMPVLEALAAGVPTACSAIEPMASIAGAAALQFPPEDEAAMLEAMTRLTSVPGLGEAGPAHAAKFTWINAAEETLRCLTVAARSH